MMSHSVTSPSVVFAMAKSSSKRQSALSATLCDRALSRMQHDFLPRKQGSSHKVPPYQVDLPSLWQPRNQFIICVLCGWAVDLRLRIPSFDTESKRQSMKWGSQVPRVRSDFQIFHWLLYAAFATRTTRVPRIRRQKRKPTLVHQAIRIHFTIALMSLDP